MLVRVRSLVLLHRFQKCLILLGLILSVSFAARANDVESCLVQIRQAKTELEREAVARELIDRLTLDPILSVTNPAPFSPEDLHLFASGLQIFSKWIGESRPHEDLHLGRYISLIFEKGAQDALIEYSSLMDWFFWKSFFASSEHDGILEPQQAFFILEGLANKFLSAGEERGGLQRLPNQLEASQTLFRAMRAREAGKELPEQWRKPSQSVASAYVMNDWARAHEFLRIGKKLFERLEEKEMKRAFARRMTELRSRVLTIAQRIFQSEPPNSSMEGHIRDWRVFLQQLKEFKIKPEELDPSLEALLE